MDEIKSFSELWEKHKSFVNHQFNGRYVPFDDLQNYLKKLPASFHLKTEGTSVASKPIYSVQIGTGKIKILMWSQMHGNETTTTKAVLDLLFGFEHGSDQLFFQKFMKSCSLKIIPMLNVDGAERYTRKNKNKVDLNRDAIEQTQPESQVLTKIFNDFDPDFCFNLHDQRTIYGVGDSGKSAVVSFLSPSVDTEKSITEARKLAMKLIVDINSQLKHHIPGNIARYDDSFNPNCVGDMFQSRKVPTLLFEAGHFPGDYQREKTRSLIFLALFRALWSISSGGFKNLDHLKYSEIPTNTKSFYDILIRNLCVNDSISDVGICFEERLRQRNKIEFIPYIAKIGDLSAFFGHREMRFEKEKLEVNNSLTITETTEIRSMNIIDRSFLMNLTNN